MKTKKTKIEKNQAELNKIWDSFLPFYSQWYWTHNMDGTKSKAWYHGPRIDWMYLSNEN